MNLKSQVVSLDLAKRLKELGVKQESMFVHVELKHLIKTNFDGEGRFIGQEVIETRLETGFAANCYYPLNDFVAKWSAFTVAELGEMLPSFYKKEKIIWKLRLDKSMKTGGYIIEYYESKRNGETIKFYDDNEANARAKMLIYLIENGLMEANNGYQNNAQ